MVFGFDILILIQIMNIDSSIDFVKQFLYNKPKWLKSRESSALHKSEGCVGMMADRHDG